MKNYAQINFDFTDSPTALSSDNSPSVGVRIKSLKQTAAAISGNAPGQEAVPAATPVPEPAATPKSTRGRKSLKAIAAEADYVKIPPDEILFQRQYYAIGEVATMFHVNQSLIRFWENEFDILQPRKNRKGDRHFRPVDIKNLELIYDLLRRRKLTIEGAKDFLKKNKNSKERFELIQSLQQIKSFLLEIKAGL